jgi:hypothetical protein
MYLERCDWEILRRKEIWDGNRDFAVIYSGC